MMRNRRSIALLFIWFLVAAVGMSHAFAVPPKRPTPPARDPHSPGYVEATELPDGAVPTADAEGNFIIGPTHKPAAEASDQPSVPHGTVFNFTMNSADSKMYPGIARDADTFGTPDP